MKNIITIIIVLIATKYILAQNETAYNHLQISNNYYKEDFSQAIELYKKMIMISADEAEGYYKLGFCYLFTAGKEDSSIRYLQKAISLAKNSKSKSDYQNEILFYLGKAYITNQKFDSAIILFENLKKNVSDINFKKIIQEELKLAESGFLSRKKGVVIYIHNLGKTINSPYSEHSPVFISSTNTLIYTSRTNFSVHNSMLKDEQYDEDIYISQLSDTGFSFPSSAGGIINSNGNEASNSVSPDEKWIYIYKDDDNGSIYKSRFEDGKFSEPVKLGVEINTRSRETHASVTADDNYLYFTSDRSKGHGGLDIYVSRKQANGTWGKPENLGSAINSIKDEEGPQISSDGNTLYFSSNRSTGFGGYDIYVSRKDSTGKWLPAENLGFPISTIEDDAFYFPVDSVRAIYSSRKSEGVGQMDLYMIYTLSTSSDTITELNGTITCCPDKISTVTINVKDLNSGGNQSFVPNPSGSFKFTGRKNHKMQFSVNYDSKVIYSDVFVIPSDAKLKEAYRSINLQEQIPCD